MKYCAFEITENTMAKKDERLDKILRDMRRFSVEDSLKRYAGNEDLIPVCKREESKMFEDFENPNHIENYIIGKKQNKLTWHGAPGTESYMESYLRRLKEYPNYRIQTSEFILRIYELDIDEEIWNSYTNKVLFWIDMKVGKIEVEGYDYDNEQYTKLIEERIVEPPKPERWKLLKTREDSFKRLKEIFSDDIIDPIYEGVERAELDIIALSRYDDENDSEDDNNVVVIYSSPYDEHDKFYIEVAKWWKGYISINALIKEIKKYI